MNNEERNQLASFVLACFSSVSMCLGVMATPTISDLKVTSVEPFGVAIDYTVSGASHGDADLPVSVSVSVNGASYEAKTLLGATNCVNGAHRVYWNMAKDGLSFDPATASLAVMYNYPLYCVVDLSLSYYNHDYHVAYMNAWPEGGFNTDEYKTTKLVLKRVEAGTFIMGDDQTNEAHRVTLTKPFYMGLFEVTEKQWYLVTGSNLCSSASQDEDPVYVSYNDIRGSLKGANWPTSNVVDGEADGDSGNSFLGRLRERTGLEFDLPTEAQWEYTCRAGTTTKYSYGDSVNGSYMVYNKNSNYGTSAVGYRRSNKWGFYDMHGNASEWCLDWYGELTYGNNPFGPSSGSERVRRGGSWSSDAAYCTSSTREGTWSNCGFRLSRPLPDAASATVEFALGRICASESLIDGKVALGYVPLELRHSVVAINDEVLLNTVESGTWDWIAATAGTYTVSHSVGDDVMTAMYVVTNGYAKIEEPPNPPMEVVDGIALSPASISIGASENAAIVNVSGSGDWTTAVSADWLSLSVASGTGAKDLSVAAEENHAAEARVGYVYVAGRTLTVTQAGRGATVSEYVSADCAGDEIALPVSVLDETTTWSAYSECAWIAVSPQSGTGSGEVTLLVLPWNRAVPRVGKVTVAGQAVTVAQGAALFECLTGTGTNVVVNGESGTLDIRAAQGVVWSATSDAYGFLSDAGWVDSWLSVADEGVSRRGDGMISWTAEPNLWAKERTATITVTAAELDGVEPLTFTVTQDAAPSSLSQNSHEFTAAGHEEVTVDVTVANDVYWEIDVMNLPSWVYASYSSSYSGRGPDKVTLNTAYNYSSSSRSATVKIANKEFVVMQAAAEFSCPSTTAVTVGAGAATNEFKITASDYICWRVTSDADWLADEDFLFWGQVHCYRGSNVFYWVAQSQTTFGEARTATITVTPYDFNGRDPLDDIEPLTFAVTQEAATAEIVGGLKRVCPAEGANLTIDVRVDVDTAPWTVKISEEAEDDWISLTSGSGPFMGDGTFSLEVKACSDEALLPRTATVMVANQELTILQTAECASITYANLMGATNENPATYQEGTTVAFETPGAVTGYTFAGWTPSAITADMTGDQIITANWKANSYTIKYDANGGAGTMDGTVCAYDEDVVIASNGFTRVGYKLVGWATVPGGAVAYAAGEKVKNLVSDQDGVIRVYAVWEVDVVPAPTVTPADGTVFTDDSCTVTLSCAMEGAKIYYRTDGKTPKTNDTYLYAGPFSVADTVEIKAVAVYDEVKSEYVTATITKKTKTFAEVLGLGDATGVALTTGGDAAWTPIADATATLGMSARSGAAGDEGESWLKATVNGAGVFTFRWKTDCEYDDSGAADFDHLVAVVDGEEFCRVDGETAWEEKTVTFFTSGEHTICWTYAKDESDASGEDCAWVTDCTWTPSAVVPAVPSVLGDSSATVTGDATSGWTVAPSEGVSSVELTIPDGVDAAKVTVEVGADVAAVTPHGAKVKVVRGGHDITDYLDVPSADAAGSIDFTKAAVKEAVVKETMDPEKGAKFEVKASEPTLTTSATKPGLTYTLREGTTLDGMSDGASKLGDGSPWTPSLTIKGGDSGFYSIKVTK